MTAYIHVLTAKHALADRGFHRAPPDELMAAAACYLRVTKMPPHRREVHDGPDMVPPKGWPFTQPTWQPSDTRGNLIQAAALLLLAIEGME